MRHRLGPALVILVFALALAAPPVLAQHGHGGPTNASGTVPIGPAGGGADLATVSLSGIGIDVASGDTFAFSWSVDNGTGPPVHFEIFAHSTSLHLVYYAKNGSQDSGTWRVPGSDAYYVSWTNPNPAWVNVSYTFQGIPNSDALWIIAVAAIFITAIVAYVAVTVRKIVRESAPPEPTKEAPPATSSPEEDGGDSPPPRAPGG